MKLITAIAVFVMMAFAANVSFHAPAEARPNVGKNIGKGVNAATRGVYRGVRGAGRGVYRGVRGAGRGVYNGARWGTRALWVGTGVGAGHAAMTRNCNYYYRRYQETRAAKWRNKYNACIR
ncbi:MAG: hypothetical protein AAF405_09250 [Pseudomonadota bacterium]